jgi:hypothetical protein
MKFSERSKKNLAGIHPEHIIVLTLCKDLIQYFFVKPVDP